MFQNGKHHYQLSTCLKLKYRQSTPFLRGLESRWDLTASLHALSYRPYKFLRFRRSDHELLEARDQAVFVIIKTTRLVRGHAVA